MQVGSESSYAVLLKSGILYWQNVTPVVQPSEWTPYNAETEFVNTGYLTGYVTD